MNRDNDKGKTLINRTIVWTGIQFAMLLLIIARLYYLQVYQADKFSTMADENRISTRILIPPRGEIVDRNGKILAGNRQNFQALVVAEQTTSIEETLDKVKKILPLDEAEEKRIKEDLKKYRRFVPIKIKDGLSWEETSRLLLASPDIPGIVIDDGLTRYYPYGEKTAHLLGYVAAVSEKDLQRDNDPLLEVPGFKIGKDGIERQFEKQLRGTGGNLKLEVNALGRVMKEIERVDGKPGEKLQLSVDARLQEKAYDLYNEKGQSGAAVLIDVNSGEILAFVSTPSYNSNDFVNGVSSKIYDALLSNERSPLLNKAIAGQYAPGSTFKMIVALAALEDGIITRDTKVYCSGRLQLGNHFFHCWKKQGHGALTVEEALKHSCDIFFYEVARQLGIEKIAAMARRFGLGMPTGIELAGEKGGLIPDKEWKMRTRGEAWQVGETMIAGIGQSYIMATPLQLAVMTARIANGGRMITPTFIKKDRKKEEKTPLLNVSKRYFDMVRNGMCAVINETGGTAYGARFDVNGQKMCGKTGTSQVRRITLQERQSGILKQDEIPWRYRDHALFVGYAPQDNPKYAVAVAVEHGGGGSSVAAPLASKLLQEALKLDIEDGK